MFFLFCALWNLALGAYWSAERDTSVPFDFSVGSSPDTIAQAACVANYGSCCRGSCGGFTYWYGCSHYTCNCVKAIGQYEWIYSNTGYIYVGQDYGGAVDDVSGDSSFVRRKTSSSCGSNPWALAEKDFPVLSRDCQEPSHRGYMWNGGGTSDNSVRTGSCASGFIGSASSITCFNGQWSSAYGCTAIPTSAVDINTFRLAISGILDTLTASVNVSTSVFSRSGSVPTSPASMGQLYSPWYPYDLNVGATSISDGGSDTYDDGNMIYVNNALLTYMDNWGSQVAGGETVFMDIDDYKAFMLVTAISTMGSTWRITGNVGADGSGFISTGTHGDGLNYGWHKSTCSGGDPTVNHMWVTNQASSQYYNCGGSSTNDDCDQITIDVNTSLLLAVYWGQVNGCLTSSEHHEIFLAMSSVLITSDAPLLGNCASAPSPGLPTCALGDLDPNVPVELAIGTYEIDDNRGGVLVLFVIDTGYVFSAQQISSSSGSFTAALASNDNFGYALSGINDINCDVIPDILVGSVGQLSGAIFVLFLSSSGSVVSFQRISSSTGGFTAILNSGDVLGVSLSSHDDLNLDGIPDAFVGLPDCPTDIQQDGRVYVVFLQTSGLVLSFQKLSSSASTFTAARSLDWFGFALAVIRDVDGDSVADLAVGAHGDDDGGNDHGSVYILFVESSGQIRSFQKISETRGQFTTELSLDSFGFSVTSFSVEYHVAVAGRSGEKVFLLSLQADGQVGSFLTLSADTGVFTAVLRSQFGMSLANVLDWGGEGDGALAVVAQDSIYLVSYSLIPRCSQATFFEFTGFAQIFTVPQNASYVYAYLWGGAGGGSLGEQNRMYPGGPGGFVSGLISVTGQTQLTVLVGNGGVQSHNFPEPSYPGSLTEASSSFACTNSNQFAYIAGVGGGRSEIRLQSGTPVLIAGGGGGAGAGTQGSGVSSGGSGGGDQAQEGACSNSLSGGAGGTQHQGGSGAHTSLCNSGGNLFGGYCTGDCGSVYSGGGGGDGYYGGGPGLSYCGGGGGSSFVDQDFVPISENDIGSDASLQPTDPLHSTNLCYDNPYYAHAGRSVANAKGNHGLVVIVEVTACPATEVPNSNYAVRGSINGVTGHFFNVTCDDGYIGGGTMTCGPNRLFNDIFCDVITCAHLAALDPSATSGVYMINPTGQRRFSAYCDLSTDGGGWTMCYTTDNDVLLSTEVASSYPYGRDGYRSDCRDVPFTSVLYVNEDSSETAWFSVIEPQVLLLTASDLGYNAGGDAPRTLFEAHGVASSWESGYQLLVCSDNYNSPVGLFMSGYTGEYKTCGNWNSDYASPYFRTAVSAFPGVAFNENGNRAMSQVITMSVGLRLSLKCPLYSLGESLITGCSCSPGFTGSVNLKSEAPFFDSTCVDIDECLQDPCPGSCVNQVGTYFCLPFNLNVIPAAPFYRKGGEQLMLSVAVDNSTAHLYSYEFFYVNNANEMALLNCDAESRASVPDCTTCESIRYSCVTAPYYGHSLSVVLSWEPESPLQWQWQYPDFGDWSDSRTSCCGSTCMLGGYGNFAGSNSGTNCSAVTIVDLPAGEYEARFTFYFIDSWENEFAFLYFNGQRVWSMNHLYYYYYDNNFCGDNYFPDWAVEVAQPVTHSGGSAELMFCSNLDEVSTNEAWGVNNIGLYSTIVRHQAFNGTFSYRKPEIATNTLRNADLSEPILDPRGYAHVGVDPGAYTSTWIEFSGDFGPDIVNVSYSNGVDEYLCEISPEYGRIRTGYFGVDTIMCRTTDISISPGFYYLSVVAGGSERTNFSNDVLVFATVPTISAISGCDDNGNATFNCTTGGGEQLHIFGESFFPSVEVVVDGLTCGSLVVLGQPYNSTELSCVLPPGTGLVVSVVASLRVSGVIPFSSQSYDLLGYAGPRILQLSHAGCNVDVGTDPFSLSDCPRNGGGTLSIVGTNLGAHNALVLVGAQICFNVQHTVPDTEITCTLPSGSSLSVPLIFIQFKGAMSLHDALISFTPCPPGTYQRGTEVSCLPCPIGTSSNSPGLLFCSACPAGTFQTAGFDDCERCFAGQYSLGETSVCSSCQPGRYSGDRAALCLDCPPGTFQNLAAQSLCLSCAAGKHQNQIGSSVCLNCVSGTFSSASGQANCAMCDLGEMQPDPGATACVSCDYGKFKATVSTAECMDCASGSYTSSGTTLFTCTWCPLGKYQAAPGQTLCYDCEPGTYQSRAAAATCSQCESGRASAIAGLSSCADCEAGKQQPLTGSSLCDNCDYGRYKAGSGVELCVACSAGSYTSRDTPLFTCAVCGRGEFQALPEATSCEHCAAGSYQGSTGSTGCVGCEVGRYSGIPRLSSCVDCEAGKQQPLTGSSECDNCEIGKFKAVPGDENCTLCEPGTYTNDGTTLFACAICSYGQYQPLSGSTACHDCERGTYQSEQSSSGCFDCFAGTYSQFTGSSSCNLCLSGSIQPSPAQYECILCPAGRFMAEQGSNSTNCTACHPGTTVVGMGNFACDICRTQQFQPEPGRDACEVCPTNSIHLESHASCECNVGFYAIPTSDEEMFAQLDPDQYSNYILLQAGSQVVNPSELLGFWCVPCPEGADCRARGTTLENVQPLEGYFLGLDEVGTDFFHCLNKACLGSGECMQGYTGPTCTQCTGDLIAGDGFECKECLNIGITVSILCFGALMILVYVYYRVQSQDSYEPRDVYIKILVSSFQVNGLALSYSFDWDQTMGVFLDIQGDATSLGIAYIEFQCLSPFRGNSFLLDTTICLVGPIITAIGVFFVMWIRKYMTYRNVAVAASKARASAAGGVAILLFFLQPYLVTRFALIFSCVKLGGREEDYFMAENLDIRCWYSSQHLFYIFALGLPYFVLYVAGVPYGLYLLLTRGDHMEKVFTIQRLLTPGSNFACDNPSHQRLSAALDAADDCPPPPLGVTGGAPDDARRKSVDPRDSRNAINSKEVIVDKDTLNFAKSYAFLFLGYKQGSFWWEVSVLVRKAVISLIGVIFAFDQRAQGMLGMVTVFLVTIAHAHSKPFVDVWLNNFELLSLLSSCATFFFGIFTLDAGDSGSNFPASSILALMINFCYTVGGIVFMRKLYSCCSWQKGKALPDSTNRLTSTYFPEIPVQLDGVELAPVTIESALAAQKMGQQQRGVIRTGRRLKTNKTNDPNISNHSSILPGLELASESASECTLVQQPQEMSGQPKEMSGRRVFQKKSSHADTPNYI